MIRARAGALTLATGLFASGATPAPAPIFTGLWQAAHVANTPQLAGDLVLRSDGGLWRAGLAGREASAVISGRKVMVDFGAGFGRYDGRFDVNQKEVDGHWIQPPNTDSGVPYASPVILRRGGAAFWRGRVDPLQDPFTFYLVVQPQPTALPAASSSTYPAFLVNPERNLGKLWGINALRAGNDDTPQLLTTTDDGKENVWNQGVYHSDAATTSFFFDDRGGTYDFRRVPDGAATNFYPRGRPSVPYVYRAPEATGDGWPVASLSDVGISTNAMIAFIQSVIDTPMDSVHAPQVHAILVARYGKLVLEEYFHGDTRERAHEMRSAAKSLTSTLFGAMEHAHFPLSPQTRVYAAMNGGTMPAQLDPLKRELTLEGLLTMSSGLDCDDSDDNSPGNEDTMEDPERNHNHDYYDFALSLKMIRPPETKAVYCSINPNLVGGVMTRVAHESLPSLFDRLLARPLQIAHYYLPLQPTGEVFMGGGVRMRARDFAKFGQMMLDGGTWNGRRVVSAQWTKDATRPRTRIGSLRYGYLWWYIDDYKGMPVQAFAALGNGGNVVMVVPRLQLVVAINAGNYSDHSNFTIEYLAKHIIPATRPH